MDSLNECSAPHDIYTKKRHPWFIFGNADHIMIQDYSHRTIKSPYCLYMTPSFITKGTSIRSLGSSRAAGSTAIISAMNPDFI